MDSKSQLSEIIDSLGIDGTVNLLIDICEERAESNAGPGQQHWEEWADYLAGEEDDGGEPIESETV